MSCVSPVLSYFSAGELIVYCNGADKSAFCELRDHHDGTFTLTVRAQDVGLHSLFVKYEGMDVPGSPFSLRVSPASLVKAFGPGLHDAFLHQTYEAQFAVDTKDAGPGDLKIRIGGPRGKAAGILGGPKYIIACIDGCLWILFNNFSSWENCFTM